MPYVIYQDDEEQWHAEELDERHKPTGYVIGPFATESEAEKAADKADGIDEESTPHVLVRGNPIVGFTFIGPFASWGEASDHSDDMPDSDWWIAPMTAPEDDDKEARP